MALHAIEPNGAMHVGERAVLHVFEGIGWTVTAAVGGAFPFHPFVALGYRVFAANRTFFAKFVFWKAHPDVKDF